MCANTHYAKLLLACTSSSELSFDHCVHCAAGTLQVFSFHDESSLSLPLHCPVF